MHFLSQGQLANFTMFSDVRFTSQGQYDYFGLAESLFV